GRRRGPDSTGRGSCAAAAVVASGDARGCSRHRRLSGLGVGGERRIRDPGRPLRRGGVPARYGDPPRPGGRDGADRPRPDREPDGRIPRDGHRADPAKPDRHDAGLARPLGSAADRPRLGDDLDGPSDHRADARDGRAGGDRGPVDPARGGSGRAVPAADDRPPPGRGGDGPGRVGPDRGRGGGALRPVRGVRPGRGDRDDGGDAARRRAGSCPPGCFPDLPSGPRRGL
ncbi:MAG: hypothetical protein AVDCRST_MAG73-3555, partial [uncultured Thermomicrobiales bacterium]